MTGPCDHRSFPVKALLRERLIAGVEPHTAVDLYAGSGRLLCRVGAPFRHLHAVEQNPEQARRLRAALTEAGLGRAVIHQQDNRAFIEKQLPELAGVSFLDFDAYNNPHPLIRRAFAVFRPARRLAVAVTDGGRLQLLRGDRARLGDWRGRDAPGETEPARLHPLLRADHELLVRSFWAELAAERGLQVSGFFGAWPPGRRVYYYGLWVEPA